MTVHKIVSALQAYPISKHKTSKSIINAFFLNNQQDALIIQIYSVIKL